MKCHECGVTMRENTDWETQTRTRWCGNLQCGTGACVPEQTAAHEAATELHRETEDAAAARDQRNKILAEMRRDIRARGARQRTWPKTQTREQRRG